MTKLFKALLCTAAVAMLTVLLSINVLAEGTKTGTVNANALNVRETPSTSAAVLTQLYADETVTIIGSGDGWYQISYGDIYGWVKSDYITVSDGSLAAMVSGDNVNLRTEGSLTADVITRLSYGDRITVLNQYGDWYYISLADGTLGWVFKDYVAIGNVSRGDSIGKSIASYAQRFLGVGYVYGGSTANGFDCSGFSKYVYANSGIYIERVAADQANQGTKVSQSALRTGDLVFFDTDGGHNYINHVGIYLGNGQFIHASSGSGKVVISSLWEGFYANSYMTAKTFTR